MKVNKAYKFRLVPTPTQEVILNKSVGSCRFIYNHFLKLNMETYLENKKFVFSVEMINKLPELKEQYQWLKETFSQSLQQVCRNLDTALKRCFKGLSEFPKFKKKGKNDSFICPQKFRVLQDKNRIMIPKVGLVKYRNSRVIEGVVKNITVSKKCGNWYVSILTEQEFTEKVKTFDKPTGIDLGIKSFAFLSNGIEIENPKFYKTLEEKVKTYQRKLSSKVKFSKNWIKQKIKLSKLHNHIANCRYDFLHKNSTDIVKKQDLISIEDLNVSGMVLNHKLAKSIHDVGWGMFVNMLEYKTYFQSKTLIKVGRFFPSSQLCSNPDCDGRKLMPLKLRTYVCEKCNTTIDRDYNASKNIELEGIRLNQLLI